MGIETTLFSSKEIKSTNEIAQILRQISEKLESGRLKLQNQEFEAEMEFPEQMKLELKLEEEQDSNLEKSFKIEIKWNVGDQPTGKTQIL